MLDQDVRFHRSLCWQAILAGAVVAMGVHLLLLALGAGIGLGVFSPQTDANPLDNFSTGSAIAWSICALIALYSGGWVAGCFSASPKTGAIHGIVVWSGTMIITFLLIASGGGLALGGAVKALGAGMGMTGKAAASGLDHLGKEGAKKATDQLNSFTDEAVQASPTNAAPHTLVRARREIGFAVSKLFAPGNDINSTENRNALTQALTAGTGMTEDNARKMVDDWVASYKNLKAELEKAKVAAAEKARDIAAKEARNLACAATISFFAFLTGLILTVCGGICGAKRTYHHTAHGVLVN